MQDVNISVWCDYDMILKGKSLWRTIQLAAENANIGWGEWGGVGIEELTGLDGVLEG